MTIKELKEQLSYLDENLTVDIKISYEYNSYSGEITTVGRIGNKVFLICDG